MFGLERTMKWCDRHLEGMRRSRRSALASICAGAMKIKGLGVLVLGRAMDDPAMARHRIKKDGPLQVGEVDRVMGLGLEDLPAQVRMPVSARRSSRPNSASSVLTA